jgi:hypothetical protein
MKSTHRSKPCAAPGRSGVRAAALSASVLLLLGCATATPVVYREGQPSAAAEQRLANDIAACRRQADRAFGANANDGRTVARQAAKYGLAEFAQEAAEALVEGSKRVWEKARAGAAGGAANAVTKLLFDWNEPDAVYKKHVERCLARRGHDVLGWR